MLQQLEGAYLATLRVAVLVFATVLLVGVVIFGFASMQALQSASASVTLLPTVTPQDLVKALSSRGASDAETTSAKASPQRELRDAKEANLIRAVKSIDSFLKTFGDGRFPVQEDKLLGMLREGADTEPSAELSTRFAQNFADALEKVLVDPAFIKIADRDDPRQMIARVLEEFTGQFDRQVAKQQADDAAMRQQYIEKKEQGMSSLYLAAGSFTLFLAVIFLLVFIRIERNLRGIKLVTSPIS